jgi:hypothetical protein
VISPVVADWCRDHPATSGVVLETNLVPEDHRGERRWINMALNRVGRLVTTMIWSFIIRSVFAVVAAVVDVAVSDSLLLIESIVT